MSIISDVVMSASVAVGNVASRERDRDMETTHEDGRPKPLGERAKGRLNAIVGEGTAKVVVSQTAHFGAKEIAKRVSSETLKKVFGALAKRPAVAAGAALFAFDTARDGFRFARGDIDRHEFAERIGGNGVGLVGAAGGAWVGSLVGTVAMPVIGTAVGSIIGGVVGGIGGDTFGRKKVRDLLGVEDNEEDWDDEDEEDET
jgi:phage tail tape-measure protein